MTIKHSKCALIVGGTSGLGLELAIRLAESHKVFITGRRNLQNEKLQLLFLDLSSPVALAADFDKLLNSLPRIDLLVYAAGFYQEGFIDSLSDRDLLDMNCVGLLAPALLVKRLLAKQGAIAEFIAITSTAQWTPRALEPMYNAVKAGFGMLAAALSLDERIGKILVAGPAGMKTDFWLKHSRDTKAMLDPKWVAEQILNLHNGDFKYRLARILRGPARTEVVESR